MAPKQATVERALAEIKKGYAQYEYFFSQLNSPAWLDPLLEAGFFRKTFEPEREGNRIRFRIWPESRYLVRMSQIGEAQERVLQIILGIPDSENSRIHDDVADIALSLPAPLAAKLVPQISRYIEFSPKLLLAEKVGDLILHLSEGGQAQAALDLARAALSLTPEPPRADAQADQLHIPEPEAHFEPWYYARIAQKAVPALADAAGIQAVSLLSGLLDDAARFSVSKPDEDDEDYLYIRYPSLQNLPDRDDPTSWLLWATREAAVRAIGGDPARLEPILEILRRHKWSSFRRLELYLSNLFPEQRAALAERFFENPKILESASLKREAIPLLKESFATLSPEIQGRILAWMDAGPPDDSIRRWLEFCEQPVTAETVDRVRNVRRRDRLSIIENQLPAPYLQALQQLKAELGEVPPERPPIRGFYQVGAQSPKSPEDLEGMPVNDVLELLASWVPGTDMFQPTAEGLGAALTAVVSKRAVEFVAVADKFKALDPTYVRSFLAGLTATLRNGGERWEWTPVLELARWVSDQPREIEGRKGGRLIADPDWGWTRDAIVDLLRVGLSKGPELLPYRLRDLVWKTLAPLTEDPFPSVESEKGEKFDPAFLSINSTRGRAVETVLDYASWVQKCLASQNEATLPVTLNALPEVRAVLDRHLDLKYEPTLTIRSIYGQMLSRLALLDWEWFRSDISLIFPLNQELSRYFTAAWESFVVFNYPAGQLLTEMIPVYQRAIAEIPKGPQMVRSPQSSVGSLAQHLMIYYWWGLIDFGGPDNLIDQFYAVAPDDVIGQAMWFVGRSVAGFDAEPPAQVFDRLRIMVERRLALAEESRTPGSFARELANFGWWFTSHKFSDDWSLNTLLRTLRLTHKTEDEMDVVKRLAELSIAYPRECVECLALMVQGDRDRWLLIGVEEGARSVIGNGIASNRAEAVTVAKRLVQDLIARGNYGFRDLA